MLFHYHLQNEVEANIQTLDYLQLNRIYCLGGSIDAEKKVEHLSNYPCLQQSMPHPPSEYPDHENIVSSLLEPCPERNPCF